MRKILFIILFFFTSSAIAQSSITTWQSIALGICNEINEALMAYQQNDIKSAHTKAMMAYFVGYDATLEPSVRTTLGSQHVFLVEQQFNHYARLLSSGFDIKQLSLVSHTANELCHSVVNDAQAVEEANIPAPQTISLTTSFSSAFIQSFIILLREGFEALLIITALLSYVRRSPFKEKVTVIYYGTGLALLASIATAIVFATFLKITGAHREASEGITMLIASFVLFYVSYWLFAKKEADKWQQFIKQKVTLAVSGGRFFTLGLAAFLAVYREGAETILFYQALLIGNQGQTLAILLGLATACVGLLFLYYAMKFLTFRIPFKLFFTLTALFLYYMAFSFIGGGILELQEAGLIDISPIAHFPQITWLGIFPAWQNIGAQLLFLIPTLLGLVIWPLYKKR